MPSVWAQNRFVAISGGIQSIQNDRRHALRFNLDFGGGRFLIGFGVTEGDVRANARKNIEKRKMGYGAYIGVNPFSVKWIYISAGIEQAPLVHEFLSFDAARYHVLKPSFGLHIFFNGQNMAIPLKINYIANQTFMITAGIGLAYSN